MLLVNLLACSAGLGVGIVATGMSIAGSKRLGDDGFWRRLSDFGRLLLSPDGSDCLVQEYWKLWPLLFAFTAKKLVVGLIAIAPVALTFAGLKLLNDELQQGTAAVGDDNLTWYSVSDWEFQFFVAVCLASVVAWFVARFKA